jgi:hypothetical protein
MPHHYLRTWIYILATVPTFGAFAGERGFHFAEEASRLRVTRDEWRGALDWLRAQGMIETSRIQHGIMIRVKNYASYQQVSTIPTDKMTLFQAKISELWSTATDGGRLTIRSLAAIDRLARGRDEATVLTHLQHYLASTSPRYLSPARFVETFGTWKQPVPAAASNGRTPRQALAGHKGTTDYGRIDTLTE